MSQISMGDSCFLCTDDSVSRQCKDKECTMLHLSQVFVHKNQFKTETKEEILSCLIWNPPQPSNLTF